MKRRAVLTGFGVISALGGSARQTWEGLIEGRVGIRPVTLFDVSRDRSRIAAEAVPFDAAGVFSNRDRARASRGDRMGVTAALAAVEDARVDLSRLDPERATVLIGGGGTGLLEAEGYLAAALSGRRPRPSSAGGFFGAATADRIAGHLRFCGGSGTLMNACSSATLALGMAASMISSGEADVALSGGVETLSRTTFTGFNSLRLVDTDPCRPFDRCRAGLSLGECAALMLIEPLDAARARGARIYAELAGWGASADAHHMTSPEPAGEGIARAMRAALQAAGVAPEEVDHVNAHGTGTEQNDPAEAEGIRAVLGARARTAPVVSIKGMVGHCLGAAGAIEAFAAAMALFTGQVPPTGGLREPDPRCDLDHVVGSARRCDLRVAVSNSLAFGGNNATLVLRRAPPLRLLFVCTGNSARSQMAEGLANHQGRGRIEAQSAGTLPIGVNRHAVEVLRERGIDISSQWSKGVEEVPGPFDRVITLCDSAAQTCPRGLWDCPTEHWSTPDPSFVSGGTEAVRRSFREVRDRLERQIGALIERLAPDRSGAPGG